jgi:hypothetical protein
VRSFQDPTLHLNANRGGTRSLQGLSRCFLKAARMEMLMGSAVVFMFACKQAVAHRLIFGWRII